MTRFRCPSGSADDFLTDEVSQHLANMTLRGVTQASTVVGPSQQRRHQKKRKLRARSSSSSGDLDIGRKERIRMAKKKESVKIHVSPYAQNWSYVYVGNLGSSIDEELLKKTFKRFGRVVRVQIRMSQGSAVKGHQLARGTDRQYASIEFADADAVNRALEFDGQEINGRKVVVSLNAADLPETKAIVTQYITRKRTPVRRQPIRDMLRFLKRITVDRTQYIESPPESSSMSSSTHTLDLIRPDDSDQLQPSNRRTWFGLSFPETLM